MIVTGLFLYRICLMHIWKDGRSGLAGCIAGNIALQATFAEAEVRKLKGTTFITPSFLIVGRVCASDDYLGGAVLHWANLSWDQHCELERRAKSQEKQLLYLFVTASSTPAAVHCWRVPGEMVKAAIEERGKNSPGATAAIHILWTGDRHLLGDADITALHTAVSLSAEQSRLLAESLEGVGTARSLPKQSLSSKQAMADDSAAPVFNGSPYAESTAFEIPMAGARSVRLSVLLPLTSTDVARLKGWIDLMADVLTEDPVPEVQQERAKERSWLGEQVRAGVQELDRGEKFEGEEAFNRVLNRRSVPHAAAR